MKSLLFALNPGHRYKLSGYQCFFYLSWQSPITFVNDEPSSVLPDNSGAKGTLLSMPRRRPTGTWRPRTVGGHDQGEVFCIRRRRELLVHRLLLEQALAPEPLPVGLVALLERVLLRHRQRVVADLQHLDVERHLVLVARLGQRRRREPLGLPAAVQVLLVL